MKFIATLSLALFASYCAYTQTTDTLLDVGGHRLHFHVVKGQGTPLLFEAGNGDDGSVWTDLLQPIYDSTGATLITYDRAGLGRSEIDTAHLGFDREVTNLQTALAQLGYTQPVVLVSHSFGGFYATRFATRYPASTLGVVLIDVVTPCFFTPEWAHIFVKSIQKEDWKIIRQHKPGLYYVLQHFEETARLMSAEVIPPAIPVTFIAAEIPPSVVKPHELEQWRTCVQAAGALPNYHLVRAKNCGHKVWKDNPQLVIQEIVQQHRRAGGAKK